MMSQESSKAEAVFAKYDPKKSGLVPVKQLVYLLRDIRMAVTPQQRKAMVDDIDPTKQGQFDLAAFRRVIEKKNRSINPEKQLHRIFRIYDQGETGRIASSNFSTVLKTVLPGERTTPEQLREILKYGRQVNGEIDHEQLTHYMIKLT